MTSDLRMVKKTLIRDGAYERQHKFSSQFWPDPMTHEDRIRLTKEYILHMMSEFDEILRELNWKLHRRGGKQFIRSNVLEELIDVFKYWLSIAQVWGFRQHEINMEFDRKSAVVEQRYLQEHSLAEATRPIAIIDIDGVLADYPASFVAYVQENLGRPLSQDGTYENLVEGLSRVEVVRWKHRYREEGFEGEHVAVMQGAAEFMDSLIRQGFFLCVVTARPYWQYKRMFSDTLRWFTNNDILFDAIIFTEDKQAFALNLIDQGKQVAFAVEDHAGQSRSIAALGIPVVLLNRPYNREVDFGNLGPLIARVDDLQSALYCISMLPKWAPQAPEEIT